MKKRYFVLHGTQLVRAVNQNAWARWFRLSDVKARTVKTSRYKGAYIITSFLGSEPELFQTAVFGGVLNGYIANYSNFEAAVRGHDAAVLRLKAQS